ncbi:hypothetical protein GCM10010420_45360 [Streptomyces glaucosporus]|uniref:DUF4352 domain-containing protein n=1 Tax=Streptomyces glaucosporus TaxID=284044 RepID=A0ABN3ISL1_9ACTN
MTQSNPGPQQWGPGQPQQPQYHGMPPQQPMPPQKKSSVGKIIGFGCLGVIAFFVLIGIVAAALGGGDDTGAEKKPPASSAPEESGDGGKKDEDAKGGSAKEEGAEEAEEDAAASPIAVSAEATDFQPTILAQGEDYTSVLVTVVNNSAEKVSVNPLYFQVTGSDGTKRTVELGVDERQIDTVELAEGEKATGTVTVKGSMAPKAVTFRNGFIGDSVRADVK